MIVTEKNIEKNAVKVKRALKTGLRRKIVFQRVWKDLDPFLLEQSLKKFCQE